MARRRVTWVGNPGGTPENLTPGRDLNGRWSLHWTCCLSCLSVKHLHHARGLCRKCYRPWMGRNVPGYVQKERRGCRRRDRRRRRRERYRVLLDF